MSIEDKIREAIEKKHNTSICLDCPVLHFCAETCDYTSMNFCDNTADEIIKEINRED